MVCNAIIAVCGAAILILLLVILLGRENALSMVRGFVLEFMHKAQNEFAANQGMVKKAAVIGMIINSPFYARLPAVVRWFVSSGAIGKIIDMLCAAPEVRAELGKDVK